MQNLNEYQDVQQIAKQTLSDLGTFISLDETEASIAAFAQTRLADLGCPETWYYSCPALVLLGSRSCLSLSGRDYIPATEAVGETNLVTVDLSPCRGRIWGDCARSFVVEQGKVVQQPVNRQFRRGLEIQRELHARFLELATPEMTCDELFQWANEFISTKGFECLDFLNNIGHSIVSNLEDRLFIEAGRQNILGSIPCFTLEPHIREKEGRWGFKHENIYYFDDRGRAVEL